MDLYSVQAADLFRYTKVSSNLTNPLDPLFIKPTYTSRGLQSSLYFLDDFDPWEVSWFNEQGQSQILDHCKINLVKHPDYIT